MVGLTLVREDGGVALDSAFAPKERFGEVFSKLRAGDVALSGGAVGATPPTLFWGAG
jgi:hypothetical protein